MDLSFVRNPISEALAITIQALTHYDSAPLSQSIRLALRVSRILGDAENLWWLDWEMRDLADDLSANDVLSEIAGLIPALRREQLSQEYIARYRHERAVWDKLDINVKMPESKSFIIRDSVETIERRIKLSSDLRPLLKWYDLRFNRFQIGKQQIELTITGSHLGSVLERISARVFAYLTRVEAALSFSESAIGLFEPHFKQVNALVQEVSPLVLSMLATAFRRLAEGDPEALSQSAMTCRRVLQAVADLVCPPSEDALLGLDGALHGMSEAEYLNRLVGYIQLTFGNTAGDNAVAAVRDLARRLVALNDLASKGVHVKELTILEARQCALLTYVVAGDILAHYRYSEPTDSD